MEPAFVVGGARVFHGDCREVLKTLPDNSVDSIVTDPPYELGFMGKKWDSSGIAYDVSVWGECLRVLKPGGHVLAFGGSRTWHRLAVAVEDAGFEIRDNIAWIYGSGFPKSLDVSKAIDKAAGEKRERYRFSETSTRVNTYAMDAWTLANVGTRLVDDPITDDAHTWKGWGTALKPAHEPVVVGRKPLVGTVAENVLAWGVGGLNIDGSRIGTGTGETRTVSYPDIRGDNYQQGKEAYSERGTVERVVKDQGRWPANVILDEVTAGLLDEQSGQTSYNPPAVYVRDRKTAEAGRNPTSYAATPFEAGQVRSGYGDRGGASRFFYVAKASKRDRNEGLEELEAVRSAAMNGNLTDGQRKRRDGSGINTPVRQNFHPTVKPTALMRYLIKLVTPPGGTVLDPFTGSGSTGKAALLDRFGFVGVELTEEYLPIIEGRLKWANEQGVETDDTLF